MAPASQLCLLRRQVPREHTVETLPLVVDALPDRLPDHVGYHASRSIRARIGIGFLNELFYGRSYSAGPGELSIPVCASLLYRAARPENGREALKGGRISVRIEAPTCQPAE